METSFVVQYCDGYFKKPQKQCIYFFSLFSPRRYFCSYFLISIPMYIYWKYRYMMKLVVVSINTSDMLLMSR